MGRRTLSIGAGGVLPFEVERRRAFSKRTSPHPIRRTRSEQAVVNRPQPVSADQEEILHYAMHGREALQVGS
jgi:hypothetical protein